MEKLMNKVLVNPTPTKHRYVINLELSILIAINSVQENFNF